MKPAINQWPKSNGAKQVLFIAQSFREVLDRRTFESFRVQTLDLQARMRELIDLAEQLIRKEIRPATLIPPAQELLRSLEIDPVIDQISHAELIEYRSLLKRFVKSGDVKIHKIKQYSELIIQHVQINYKNAIEEGIKISIKTPSKKTKLRRLIQCYSSHLINCGYSRSFILHVANDIFFERNLKIAGASLLNKFFSNFSGERKEYAVHVPVRKGTIAFLNTLGVEKFRPSKAGNLPKFVGAAISSSPEIGPKDQFFTMKTKALDPFQASDQSRQTLRLINSATVLEDRGVIQKNGSVDFVTEAGKRHVTRVRAQTNRLQLLKTFTTLSQGSRVKEYTASVVGDFSENSTERIVNALDIASLARFSDNPENQLTLIWSAIEALFGNPADEDSSRITYYQDCLVPCLCINYAWRNSLAVSTDLITHHRKAFESIIIETDITPEIPIVDKFQNFIFLKKYESHHQKLLDLINFNPLAINRIFNFKEKFKDPGRYLSSLKDHEMRVRWQISRIYRARNEFVHAGRRPSFIDSLSLNAFEYLKTAIHALIYRSKVEKFKRDIDYFQAGIEISYASRMSELAQMTGDYEDRFIRLFRRA